MLKYYKTADAEAVVAYIAKLINRQLSSGKRVFWLLAGGSFIAIEVDVALQLATSPNIRNLSVSLIDERYGPAGHRNSNWQQLIEAGFKLEGAALLPVLQGKDDRQTLRDYSSMLTQQVAASDYVLVMAGIGPDGHVLGIKPNSPAVDCADIAIAYAWEDYQRITATAELLEKAHQVVVYAVGEEKKSQLIKLQGGEEDINQQPAQLLKVAPDVIVFNDTIGQDYKEGL